MSLVLCQGCSWAGCPWANVSQCNPSHEIVSVGKIGNGTIVHAILCCTRLEMGYKSNNAFFKKKSNQIPLKLIRKVACNFWETAGMVAESSLKQIDSPSAPDRMTQEGSGLGPEKRLCPFTTLILRWTHPL